jgi:hypothetical protein
MMPVGRAAGEVPTMTNNSPNDSSLTTGCESVAYRAGRVHSWLEPVLRQSSAAEHAYAFKGRL